jgi:microcystin-dependent protein
MTTTNKGLNQPGYNTYVNTWGTGPLNDNFGFIDLALGGSTLLNATGLGGTTVALTLTQCRPATLAISGSPGGTVTYTVPAGVGGQWIVRNGVSDGSVIRLQSASGGTYVTITAGDNLEASCDGSASGMVRNTTAATNPAGSNTQIQYNSAGALAGSAGLTFDGTTLAVTGLNNSGNTVLGDAAGDTLTVNSNAMSIPNTLNIGSNTLYLSPSGAQVGIGTTTVGANKLTVAGTVASTAGGFVFPDSTVQTTAAVAAAIPAGTLTAYAGASAPTGWLLCYGQAISRTTYSDLFSAIGTTWGSGDGSTTFNVPDLRGRLVAGADNMGGSAAGRLGSGATGGITGSATVGATGGEQSHQLTTAELAAHTHGNAGGQTALGGSGGGSSLYGSPGTGTTSSTGGDVAHNNVQPTAVANWIIKT